MMQFSEKTTTLNENVQNNNNSNNNNVVVGAEHLRDSQISLIPLWEHVVRTNTLPASLNLDLLFASIHQRLRNPEWEVRQHALRVLADFIPLLERTALDAQMARLLDDLTTNLGHVGPAVRKAAVDCLRIYLRHAVDADRALRNLIANGIERAHENGVQSNVVHGIVLSLPFLLTYKTGDDVLSYTIRILFDKLTGTTQWQETVVRSLFRIRELIGTRRFERELSTMVHGDRAKKRFETLCDIYNLHRLLDNEDGVLAKEHEKQLIEGKKEADVHHVDDEGQTDKTGNFGESNGERNVKGANENGNLTRDNSSSSNYDEDDGEEERKGGRVVGSGTEDKVILETEIKLNSGSAIMMKIHEESRQNSVNDTTDSEEDSRHLKTFKVLSDSDHEDYDLVRRTPRRVHFGGEIVKLRTPDSDSNQFSDDSNQTNKKNNNNASIVIKPGRKSSESLIEIRYVDSNGTRISSRTRKSLIPVRKRDTQSAPNSPRKTKRKQARRLGGEKSRSSPNLSRIDAKRSRIPRRFVYRRNEQSIRIEIDETNRNVQVEETGELSRTLMRERKLDKSPNGSRNEKRQVKPESNPREQHDRKWQKSGREQEIQSGGARSNDDAKKTIVQPERQQQVRAKQQQIEANQRQDESKFEENAAVSSKTKKETRAISPIPGPRRNSREDEFSPIPIHNEIEVFHNLTRSPERQRRPFADATTTGENRYETGVVCNKDERPIAASDNVYFTAKKPVAVSRTTDHRIEHLHPSTAAAATTRQRNNRPSFPNGDVMRQRSFSEISRVSPLLNLPLVEQSRDVSSPASSQSQSSAKTSSSSGNAIVINRQLSAPESLAANNNYQSFKVYRSNSGDSFDLSDTSKNGLLTSSFTTTATTSTSSSREKDEEAEKFNKTIADVIDRLQFKGELRTKQEALEDLSETLRKATDLQKDSIEPSYLSSLFNVLFYAEQQTALQHYAEEALTLLLTTINERSLLSPSKIQQVLYHLCKIGSPVGIRLAIVIMRRVSPNVIVDELANQSIFKAKSSKVREGALQILMTITRLFPSNEIDAISMAKRVLPLLSDRKRRVRQGALELIATLAQLLTPSRTIEILSQGLAESVASESDMLIAVVQARLSRKQLPIVDANGIVKYTAPSGDVEVNWLESGSGTPSPQSASMCNYNNRKANNIGRLRSNSAAIVLGAGGKFDFPAHGVRPAGGEEIGQWRANSRTYFSDIDDKRQRFDQRDSFESEPYWSQNSSREDSANNKVNTQIWAIDPKIFATNGKNGYGAIKPLFVVEPGEKFARNGKPFKDQNANYVRTSRGRSFSPPKRTRQIDAEEGDQLRSSQTLFASANQRDRLQEGSNDDDDRLDCDKSRRRFVHLTDNRRFRKSFSSEQLQTCTEKLPQPHFLSSGSSGSAGSSSISSNATYNASRNHPNTSAGNGIWYRNNNSQKHDHHHHQYHVHHHQHYKDVRSGIPVAINSDFKMRFKSNKGRNETSNRGPMTTVSAPHYNNNSNKPASPRETPDKLVIEHPTMTSQPFSFGSDSSGYFTPPADPPEARPISRNDAADRFVKIDSQTDLANEPNATENFASATINEHSDDDGEQPADVVDAACEDDAQATDDDNDDDDEIDFVEHVSHEISIETRSNRLRVENSFVESGSDEETGNNYQRKIAQETVSLEEKAFDQAVVPRDDSFNFDEIDFDRLPRPDPDKNVWSKSELKLNETPLLARKTIASAPSDHLKAIEYKPAMNDEEELNENPPAMVTMKEPPKTAIPGSSSIDYETTIVEKSPTKLFVGSRRRKLRQPLTRKLSCRTPRSSSLYYHRKDDADDGSSRPFNRPRETYAEIMELLESLEWESTMKGLRGLNKLIKFHSDIVDSNMHAVCTVLGKHIRNLRSQVARTACNVATEMFRQPLFRKTLEMELEELAAPLLHRTADTNKFLRNDANTALDEMSVNISTPRVVTVVASRGGSHPNAVVRSTTARLLCAIVQRIGAERAFQMPRDTRDRILYVSANLLLEGSLETRKHAKLLFGLLCNHTQFNRALTEAVPAPTLRHIAKTLKTLK